METGTERNLPRGTALITALTLGVAGCALLVAGCASHGPRHGSPSSYAEEGARPDVELLLGIHRTAGLLLGDASLRTVLEGIRLRVNDPMILERSRRRRGTLVPASRQAQDRMRETLERAFADRLLVLPAGYSDDLEPPTHALESTFSEQKSGVEIKFRLMSIDDNRVTGSARRVAEGANLSFLNRKLTFREAGRRPALSTGAVGDLGAPADPDEAPAEAASPPVAGAEPSQSATNQAVSASPPPSRSARPTEPGSVPSWISEILSRYPTPTEPGD